VLENAMSVIFFHRVQERKRRYVVSALLPYCYVLSLGGVSGVLLYLLGFAGEVFVLTSIYLVMPVGRLKLTHALVGGVTAAVLWEITRHLLLWYLRTLSQVNVVYGSLTTAIVVLLSLELAATLLLFGAQVIAEYERIGTKPIEAPARRLRTG